MSHMCYFCGEPIIGEAKTFRNMAAGVLSYAHKECFDSFHIASNFIHGIKTYRFRGQLRKLLDQGYTLEGVTNTIKYWYGVKGNSDEKANGGIGIVPYVYEEAQEYYNKKKEKKAEARRFSNEDYHAYAEFNSMPLPKVPKRKPPIKPRGVKYIDLD